LLFAKKEKKVARWKAGKRKKGSVLANLEMSVVGISAILILTRLRLRLRLRRKKSS
jgi:hypothetical protein